MTSRPQRFIFNRYQLPAQASGSDMYANDPVVQLDEGQEYARSQRQRAALHASQQSELPAADPIFGAALGWAYREYIVHQLAPPDDSQLPLGIELPQPADYATRQAQLHGSLPVDRPAQPGDRRLCLFNVLVALEWQPSDEYLRQLAWAFRRASDFLYDVTDGRMAFGQVVFGGPELLAGADIQIMASNRLHPRTWVSGLHDTMKYMSIRVGRGMWHKNNRISMPWNEPEAYRTLVHEWGHYALELPDEYLETQQVFLPEAADTAASSGAQLARGTYAVVIPGISLATESIMGTLEGTSELVPQYRNNTEQRKQHVWRIVQEKGRYPFFDPIADRAPLEGPGRLPLPLPRVQQLPTLAAAPEELWLTVPHTIEPEHCWVYLLRGAPEQPDRLLAQGTLDDRALADGFRLLGARLGDTVVLIGAADNELLVLAGTITGVDATSQSASIPCWREATPPAAAENQPNFPIVDVLPSRMNPAQPDDQLAQISVRVLSDTSARRPQLSIYPHGQLAPTDVITLGAPDGDDWTSAPHTVPSLDGHVLLRWSDGSMLIYSYSQGGGPATHVPPGPPSISAGSSEGNVMLFFERDQQGRDYSAIHMVTTLLHGVPYQLPGNRQARSYAFSVAGNEPLPLLLHPTLIMYFDLASEQAGGKLLIHRQLASGEWQAVPTYQPAGSSFVAMPIQRETASSLVAQKPLARRVERFRIYWTPNQLE